MLISDFIKDYIFLPLAMIGYTFWCIGTFSGALIAAIEEELIDLVLSIFIPGYGAIYTILYFVP